MRPVYLPDEHPDYLEAEELGSFTQATNAAGFLMTVEEVILQLQWLIDIWVNSGMQVNNKRTSLDESKKIWPTQKNAEDYEALRDCVGNGYGSARWDLIEALGQYCSYCEVPLYSHISVEHTLAKAMFPAVALSWSNFLLACPSCNSTKGSDPDQGIVTPPNTIEAVEYIENPENYLWPQRFWQGLPDGSALPYRYVLKHLVTAKEREVTGEEEEEGKGLYNLFFGQCFTVAEIEEYVDLYQRGELTVWWGKVARRIGRRHDLMAVQVLPNPQATAAQQRATRAMIRLAGLNRILPANKSSASVDRRVELRTLAYFKARLMLNLWTQAWQTGSPALQSAVTNQVGRTMRATGFWGVWFTIFGSQPTGQAMLRSAIQGTATTQWV